MFGASQTRNEVFVLKKDKTSDIVTDRVKVTTKILPLRALKHSQLRELSELQGKAAVSYLKFRYGSLNTYILLAYVGKTLAHVEWIVPASKIRFRYNFVTNDSYSIISCLTSQSFRGLGIYPSQIQKVVESDIPARMFWIWTASTNIPSLKGIRKAGGVKVGEFVQKKRFWGCISHVKYFPGGNDSK